MHAPLIAPTTRAAGWLLLVLVIVLGVSPAVARDADSEVDDGLVAADDASDSAPPEEPESDEGNASNESAPAAESGDSLFQGVEEMFVYGQPTVGVGLDSAVSVTAFDQGELDALGVQDVSDIAQFTPNLEIRTASATAGTFFIRGVGLNDFTANAAGAIAVFQDDVQLELPAIQLSQLFDVERVEVLRGPQGSGPDRNASGGSIRMYSRKPSGDYGGNFRVSYGRFNEIDVEGAVEAPILPDVLSARLAFRLSRRDPIMQNRCGNAPPIGLDRVSNPGFRVQPGICSDTQQRVPIINPNPPPRQYFVSALPTGLDDALNDRNNWAARLQLRFEPTELDMEWTLNLHGGRLDQLPTGGQAIGTVGFVGGNSGFFGGRTASDYRAPEIVEQEEAIYRSLGGGVPDDAVIRDRAQLELGRRLAEDMDDRPFEGDFNRVGHETQTNAGGFLRGTLELGFAELNSVTGAEYYERNRNADSDYTSDNIFEFLIDDEAWQFTQELRLRGELESLPVEWDTGASFLMGVLDYDQRTVPSPVITDVAQIYEQKTLSFASWADVVWRFIDDFSLEGGIRINYERKALDIDLRRQGVLICTDTVDPVSGAVARGRDCDDTQVWVAPTGYIGLNYHLTSDALVYLKYSRGWKSGQFSPGGASGAPFTVADPEVIDAFEVGIRGAWFDDMLTVQAALFHYSYEEYQVFLAANNANSPPQRVVTNASDAIIYGGELEVVLEPLEGLTFTSRFGWIESEFLDFTQEVFRSISQGPTRPPRIIPITIDWTGNRLPNTPRFKWSGVVEYEVDIGSLGQVIPRWDFVWTDDVSFDASNGRGAPNLENEIFMPRHAIGQKAYWLHNVNLTYRTPGDGSIEITGWVRNVTDEVYKTLAFDASAGAGLVGNLIGDPRTYGLTVGLKW